MGRFSETANAAPLAAPHGDSRSAPAAGRGPASKCGPMSRPELQCAVTTHYLPDQSSTTDDVYAFAYTITIRNTGDVAAQVIGRHWVITHGSGQVEEVRGLGVVGQQPLLKPGEQ